MGRKRKAWLAGERTKGLPRSQHGKRFENGKALPGYYVLFNEYPHGERVCRSKNFDTQKLARRWKNKYNAQADLRIVGDIVPIDLETAIDEFLESCAMLATGTIQHYSNSAGELLGHVGNKSVCDITGSDIDRMLAKYGVGRKDATAAKLIAGLRRFFLWAMSEERRYLGSNPLQRATVLPPTKNVRKRPPVTDDQLERLIGVLDTEDRKIAAWIAMTAGLDRSVIRHLCTAQIDRDVQAFRIHRPKTAKRKAVELVIPIHELIAPLLYARLRETEPYQPILSGLHRQEGKRDWWNLARKAAGLPNVYFRDLRAVASSRPQRMAGLPLRAMQELLGHSSIQTTAAHYHIPDPGTVKALNSLPLPGLSRTAKETTG